MGIDWSRFAIPKGEPRKRVKGRKQRAERAVKQDVRAACLSRDHECRYGAGFWRDDFDRPAWLTKIEGCDGPSEWAHIAGHRRSQTRGQAPERRHNTRTSLMLCKRHHGLEEAGKLKVIPLTARGCDGPLRFEVNT